MKGPDGRGTPIPGRRVRPRPSGPPVDPRLLRFDPSVRWLLVSATLLELITAAALIAQASALAAIIARTFLEGAGLADHRGWITLLVGAVGVRATATWTGAVVAQRTSARVKARLRAEVVDHVTRMAPGEVAGSTGEVTGALTDGVDALDGTFVGYLPALVSGVVVPVVIVAWLLGVETGSALVLAVTLPLIPMFMFLIGFAARASTRRRFRALTSLSGQLLAVLEGMATIRVARAAGRIRGVVRDAGERLRATTLETLRIAFLSALTLELLAALAVATVAVIAGVRLAEGTGVAFEPVLVALLLAPEAFLPLRRVGQQFHANEDGAAAAEQLFDLLEAPTHELQGTREDVPDPATSALSVLGVSVVHPDRSAPALDAVDLTIRPGELTVVLGATGAGKSSLATLLLGLRRPDRGRILVGDVPLDEVDPDRWHRQVAWVPQEPADLPGTVRELVTAGHPDPAAVDDARLWWSLGEVHLTDEVAALPAGLATRLGPGGRGISVGQRRRLAIARALIRPAGLLVLDEPTGDLDVVAESAVRKLLADLRGRRTVVVLTHRVPLATEADRVIVLDRGRVVEEGTPTELLRRTGAFATLVDAARPLSPDEVPHERSVDVAARRAAPVAERSQRTPAAAPTLRTLLSPYRRLVAVAATAGAVTPLAGVLLVALSTYLISRAALQPNLLDLTVVIVGVRALSLLKGTSRYAERLVGHNVALRIVADLRTITYDRLVPRIPAGLGAHRIGDVLARVVSDVERLQLALVRGVVPLLGGITASVAVVAVGWWLLAPAAIVLAVGLAIVGVAVPLLSVRLTARPEFVLARARGRHAAELVELLQAAPELRLLGRVGTMRHHLDILDAEVARHDRTSVLRGGGSDALVQLGLGLTAVGLVLVGVPAVGDGRLDGVVLGAVVVLALASIDAVGPLPTSARALVTAKVAVRRLREVLEGPLPVEEAWLDEHHDDPRSPETCPELTFDRVSARYPTGPEPAVVGIDLRLARGQRVAVVGRSGAGKSTLASLAVRFLDPEEGTVRLDDTPLVHLPGDDVRRWITLAPQDGHIFEGTIESNLRLAAPEADLPALLAALGEAQLGSWVAEQPERLQTPVGERGSRLSGGQRHRLALARALLSPGPLLVVDEPTADLDPVTGRAFLRDLLRVGGRRGLLLLTHDLRALPVVDEVVVLEGGRVRARGRHRDLLRDPVYARWWQLETAGISVGARSPSFLG